MTKNLILWLIIAAVLFTVFQGFQQPTSGETLSYSEFIEAVQNERVREVTIEGLEIQGTLRDGRGFSTVRPQVSDDGLMADLLNHRVAVEGKLPETASLWQQLLVASFPILIIIAVLVFFQIGRASSRGVVEISV